jgi:hypothetical protein
MIFLLNRRLGCMTLFSEGDHFVGRQDNVYNTICIGETILIPYSLPEPKMAQTWNTNGEMCKRNKGLSSLRPKKLFLYLYLHLVSKDHFISDLQNREDRISSACHIKFFRFLCDNNLI